MKVSSKLLPHYSGKRSRNFWIIISGIIRESERSRIFRLATSLQNLEEQVLNEVKQQYKSQRINSHPRSKHSFKRSAL